MNQNINSATSFKQHKTSWFEFLLNDALLETHLNENIQDPSPTELIALFLYQKDAAVATAREIKHDPLNLETPAFSENRKIKALKHLALKVAAFLKWDLDALNNSIPLAMVQDMLLELLRCTLGEQDADPGRHTTLDFQALSDQAVFSIQLYHRWCVKVIVDETFPSRPSKTQAVQVPGLDIPVLNPANGKETVMNIVKEGLTSSMTVLENLTTLTKNIQIPTMQSLGHVALSSDAPSYDWSLGFEVPADEIKAQVAYDLGRIHFLNQKFPDANAMFQTTREALSKLVEPYLKELDEKRISGYCMACESIIGKPSEPTLVHKVQAAKKNKYKGMVEVLIEDHQTWQLSLGFRESLEHEVKAAMRGSTVCTEVMMSNLVARAIKGITMATEHEYELQMKSQATLSLLQWVTSSLSSLNAMQKLNMKTSLRYLCYKLDFNFCKKVVGSKAIKLFNADDIKEIKLLIQQQSKPPEIRLPDVSGIEQAELERRLLISYDAKEIKELVHKLLNKNNKHHIMFLSEKWKLPRELSHLIDGVAIQWVQVYSHVLIAKSRVCINLKKYVSARELLQAADSATKDIAYKLGKHLRWQLVRVELLHGEQLGFKGGFLFDGLKKTARICIASLDSKHDIHPHPQTVSIAVAFMFNHREWKYFETLSKSNNEYVKLCLLLSGVCTTFPHVSTGDNLSNVASARKTAKELWEHVLQNVLTTGSSGSSFQTKRTSSGGSTSSSRETKMTVPAFIQFVKKIKEPTAVSALLSLTVKIYTMLKSDLLVELFFEYSPLWPSALNNSSSISVSGVCDAVAALIQHALTLQPNNLAWLRTKADLCLSASQYSQAMKYYLTIGVLTTEYFTDSVNRIIFEEQILKRMVRCCSHLQCHTQVALLCQCLEDIDYPTAFKALQESTSWDAMDGYYEYIWDSTMLEFIINLHHRRGESAKKNKAIKAIGQMELNSSNPTEILMEAAKVRKHSFYRSLAKLYL